MDGIFSSSCPCGFPDSRVTACTRRTDFGQQISGFLVFPRKGGKGYPQTHIKHPLQYHSKMPMAVCVRPSWIATADRCSPCLLCDIFTSILGDLENVIVVLTSKWTMFSCDSLADNHLCGDFCHQPCSSAFQNSWPLLCKSHLILPPPQPSHGLNQEVFGTRDLALNDKTTWQRTLILNLRSMHTSQP